MCSAVFLSITALRSLLPFPCSRMHGYSPSRLRSFSLRESNSFSLTALSYRSVIKVRSLTPILESGVAASIAPKASSDTISFSFLGDLSGGIELIWSTMDCSDMLSSAAYVRYERTAATLKLMVDGAFPFSLR